ncbi:zinc ribbon domain-containing protein [bacterium]|nr:zinc ribbon domain-containing protein [bacterium]
MAQCSNCGNLLPVGAKHCPDCGTTVSDAPAAPPKAPKAPGQKLALDELLLRGVMGLFLLILGGTVLFVGYAIVQQGIGAGAP